MKLDLHNDKRLLAPVGKQGPAAPAPSSSGGGAQPTDQKLEQYRNAYNKALKEGKTAEAQQYFNQAIDYARTNGVLDARKQTDGTLASLALELEGLRGKDPVALATESGKSNFQVESGRRTTQLQAIGTEQNSILGAKMIVPQMQLGWYGILKIGAEVLGFFGVDTKDFEAKMDQKIEDIKYPKVDDARFADVKGDISSQSEEDNVRAAVSRSQGYLTNKTPEQMTSIFDSLLKQTHSGSAGAPAPKADLPTQQDITTKTTGLIKDGIMDQAMGRKVVSAWMSAAANSGDKGTLDTAADQNVFDNVIDRMIKSAALSATAGATVKRELAPALAGPAPAPH